MNDEKKPSRKRGKLECNKDENQKKPNKEKCELVLEERKSQEQFDQFAVPHFRALFSDSRRGKMGAHGNGLNFPTR